MFQIFQGRNLLPILLSNQQTLLTNVTAILAWIKKQEDDKAQREEDRSFVDARILYPKHVLPFDVWADMEAFDEELDRVDNMLDHFVSRDVI